MEMSNFLKLLRRQRFTLVAIPLIAIFIAYFLVRKMPDSYGSKGRLATGLVDQSQQELIDNGTTEAGDEKINRQFNNLMQIMQLKKMYDQISYLLMIHDLTSDSPYHKPSKLLKYLPKEAKKHAIEVFKQKYAARDQLSLWDDDQRGLNQLIGSMGYDDESLKKKMTIYRSNNSDFIDLEFESDSPQLSAFVINSLCTEFIAYYSFLIKENQNKAINFLDSLMRQKRALMNSKMQDLKSYKIQNRVLNLNEQAKSLYAQIADFETKKETTEKDIIAFTGAIKSIDDKFNPKDRKYIESTFVKINQEIIRTKDLMIQEQKNYVISNFDPKIKSRVDSLQNILTAQINQSTDKYILNPLATKENLVSQKLNLEMQLELALNSVNTLKAELVKLNQKFDLLVPHEAVIQSFETEIDIASKEYIEILKKFNQTSIESSISVKLRQIELAMPGGAQPSKKMIIIVVSGLLSFVLCMVVMFVLFYLDESINVSKELADKTDLPVLGYLPFIKTSMLDLAEVWHEINDKRIIEFRNLLRSTRFEIDQEMKSNKLLLVTSLKAGEGKTITVLSLAYAYAATNKKVLVIDGNFADPTITNTFPVKYFLEDYLNDQLVLDSIDEEGNVCIMGTRGGDVSLLELSNESNIQKKLADLESRFDIVIVEMASLDSLNRSKEWIIFSKDLIAVYEAGQTLTVATRGQLNYLKSLDTKFIGWVLNKTGSRKVESRKRKWFRKFRKQKI